MPRRRGPSNFPGDAGNISDYFPPRTNPPRLPGAPPPLQPRLDEQEQARKDLVRSKYLDAVRKSQGSPPIYEDPQRPGHPGHQPGGKRGGLGYPTPSDPNPPPPSGFPDPEGFSRMPFNAGSYQYSPTGVPSASLWPDFSGGDPRRDPRGPGHDFPIPNPRPSPNGDLAPLPGDFKYPQMPPGWWIGLGGETYDTSPIPPESNPPRPQPGPPPPPPPPDSVPGIPGHDGRNQGGGKRGGIGLPPASPGGPGHSTPDNDPRGIRPPGDATLWPDIAGSAGGMAGGAYGQGGTARGATLWPDVTGQGGGDATRGASLWPDIAGGGGQVGRSATLWPDFSGGAGGTAGRSATLWPDLRGGGGVNRSATLWPDVAAPGGTLGALGRFGR